MPDEQLTIEVAPNIVQDLGLNLYTSAARALVEFVANAYDADSPDASIALDEAQIASARRVVKQEWELEKAKRESGDWDGDEAMVPLELRTLPEDIEIVIQDHGHGMSRDDLQKKFLVVSRRRREEEHQTRSPDGRILMGRKGLGKLAGFGVAQRVVVLSRKKGEDEATRITLDYEKLLNKERLKEVEVPTETLDGRGEVDPYGTRIILSKLVYDPVKSRAATIGNAIADHFSLIDPGEFRIQLNGDLVEPAARAFAYAYPEPSLAPTELVEHSYTAEDGQEIAFQYRIRFRKREQHLQSRERGIRVYANRRLAAAPDLLDLKTGIHGHRNTHYLDGIVHADFIDEQPVDYIATDRQTLRWEAPLLEEMRSFLTEQMQVACNEYQKTIDTESKNVVKNDEFTNGVIDESSLPPHRKRLAWKVATVLNLAFDDGIESDEYKTQLPILVSGIGQGGLLKAIADLASGDRPDLHELVARVTELTAREFGDFIPVVQGRINGIEALRHLYTSTDFKKANNEDELHELLERCPWLIDPTFTQFLTSNQTENELNQRLAAHLKVADATPADYDKTAKKESEEFGTNKRPDLVFLLSNTGLHRVVIVELKAPNTPLHNEHLTQLKGYIRRAKAWLKAEGGDKAKCSVQGFLIGSKSDPDIHQEKVEQLRYELDARSDSAEWQVFDIGEVLDRAKDAHRELLDVYNAISASPDAE